VIYFASHFFWDFYHHGLANLIVQRHTVRIPECLDKSEAKFEPRGKIAQASLNAMPKPDVVVIQRNNPKPADKFAKRPAIEKVE